MEGLALTQRLAGDLADAKLTAEQARNTLEQIYKDQPNNYRVAGKILSEAYAVMGEKDMALQAAERAITLMPRAKDAVFAPRLRRKLGTHSDDRTARRAAPSRFSASCYKRPIIAGFTTQRPLRRPFLGSIRSGTLCAAIPLSKNSARKSRHEFGHESTSADCAAGSGCSARHSWHIGRLITCPHCYIASSDEYHEQSVVRSSSVARHFLCNAAQNFRKEHQ